jgi:hypothetical protein
MFGLPMAEPVAVVAPAAGVTTYRADAFAGAQIDTAYDMVGRLPGFTLDDGQGVRGFAGSAGNVLIDGQRAATKTDTLHDALNRIPANRVERIDVIRGGAPGIDMMGRSVVANVVLKTAPQTSVAVAVGARAFANLKLAPNARFEVDRKDGDLHLTGSLAIFSQQSDSTGDGTSTVRTFLPSPVTTFARVSDVATDKGFQTRSGLEAPLGKGFAHVNLSFNYDTYRETEGDDVIDLSRASAPRVDTAHLQVRTRKGELGADYVLPISKTFEVKVIGLQTLETDAFDAGTLTDGVRQTYLQVLRMGESIGRLELKWTPNPTLTIEAGGEAVFNFLSGAAKFSQDGTRIPLPSDNIRVEELRGEAFTTASWQATPKLLIEAGARIEASRISQSGDSGQSEDFVYPKPRIALTWSPTKVDQIRTAFERVVGQLNFYDFASSANLVSRQVNGGNANLKPQQEWRMEATYERKILRDGSIALTLRHAEIQDVLDVAPVNGVNALGNIGDGRRDTAILFLTAPLSFIGMTGGQFKVDGVWIDSEVTDPTTGVRRAISLDSPHSVDFTLQNDVPRLSSVWIVSLSTSQNFPAFRIDEVRKDIYSLDATFTWEVRPTKTGVLHFEIDNLLGRDHRRTRTDWTGPRNVSPLLFMENYQVSLPPSVYIRWRQTF